MAGDAEIEGRAGLLQFGCTGANRSRVVLKLFELNEAPGVRGAPIPKPVVGCAQLGALLACDVARLLSTAKQQLALTVKIDKNVAKATGRRIFIGITFHLFIMMKRYC